MTGAFDDVAWDLRWTPADRPYEHVHPLLQARQDRKDDPVASSRRRRHRGHPQLPGYRPHALRRARRAGPPLGLEARQPVGLGALLGLPRDRRRARPDTFVDGVSVFVPRFGREIGPSTPVVGRVLGEDFGSTSPLVVTRSPSRFGLTNWRFEARDGARKLVGTVEAPRDGLVGVTYQDPDGQQAYCYNSEVASMQLEVWDRVGRGSSGWQLRDSLVSDGRAHFEYAQRDPVPGVELHLGA